MEPLKIIPFENRGYAVSVLFEWRNNCINDMNDHVLLTHRRRSDNSSFHAKGASPLKQEIQIVNGQVVSLQENKNPHQNRVESEETCWREKIDHATPESDYAKAYYSLAVDFYFSNGVAVLADSLDQKRMCLIMEYAIKRLMESKPALRKMKGWNKKEIQKIEARWASRWKWLQSKTKDAWTFAIVKLCQQNTRINNVVDYIITFLKSKSSSTLKEKAEGITKVLDALAQIQLSVRNEDELDIAIRTICKLTKLFEDLKSKCRLDLKAGIYKMLLNVGKTITKMLEPVALQKWRSKQGNTYNTKYNDWCRCLENLYSKVKAWLDGKWFRKDEAYWVACPLLVVTLRCSNTTILMQKLDEILVILEKCLPMKHRNPSKDLKEVAIQGAADLLHTYVVRIQYSGRDNPLQKVQQIISRFFVISPTHEMSEKKDYFLNSKDKGSLHDSLVRMIVSVADAGYLPYCLENMILPALSFYSDAIQETRKPPSSYNLKQKRGALKKAQQELTRWEHNSSCLIVVLEGMLKMTNVDKNTLSNSDILREMQKPLTRTLVHFCRQVFAKCNEIGCSHKRKQASDPSFTKSLRSWASPFSSPTKDRVIEPICLQNEMEGCHSIRVYKGALLGIPLTFDLFYNDSKQGQSTRFGNTGVAPLSPRPLLLIVTDSRFHPNDEISSAAFSVIKWAAKIEISRCLIANRMIQICTAAVGRLDPYSGRYLDYLQEFLEYLGGLSPAAASTNRCCSRSAGKTPLGFNICSLETLYLVTFCHPSASIRGKGFYFLEFCRRLSQSAKSRRQALPLPIIAESKHKRLELECFVGNWDLIGLRNSGDKSANVNPTGTRNSPLRENRKMCYLHKELDRCADSVFCDVESHSHFKTLEDAAKSSIDNLQLLKSYAIYEER